MNQQTIDNLAHTYSDRIRDALIQGTSHCLDNEFIVKLCVSAIRDCITIMLAAGYSEALVRLLLKTALDNAAKTIDSLRVEMAEH